MGTEGKKSWERPWTMEEIIENSDHWTLACDSAVLTTLKSFSDNLLTKSKEINNNLNSLCKKLDDTGLELHLAQNKFHRLKNTQFIESRVYEDDESIQQTPPDPKDNSHDEVDHTDNIRLAALKGLEVIDKYFDKVEVSVSDSEDDDTNMPNYVLRPKDLYLERPLPHVIGTQEWYKSNNVGLESSSESETEKVSDFSESDDEETRENGERSPSKQFSSSNSELEFNKSDDSVPNSAPTNFAEELAQKLGNVINEEKEVNTRPINTFPSRQYGDPFFDEPPPLEPKGLFSPSSGLFDDESDHESSESLTSAAGNSKDLFDDVKTILPQSNLPKVPIFNEDPPDLEASKAKPAGGVAIFGGGNIFDKKFLKPLSSIDDESADESTLKPESNISPPLAPPRTTKPQTEDLFSQDFEDEPITKVPKQKTNLFDDDLFENDLFSTSKPKVTSLFDDEVPTPITVENERQNPTAAESERTFPKSYDDLFGSSPETNDDLFADVTSGTFKAGGLFMDEPPPLFNNLESPELEIDDNFEDLTATPSVGSKPKFDIFGDSPPEDDLFSSPLHSGDIFSDLSTITKVTKVETLQEPEVKETIEESSKITDHLRNKPENDDESRTLAETADSLPEKDEAVKKVPGKLKINMAINVKALLPNSQVKVAEIQTKEKQTNETDPENKSQEVNNPETVLKNNEPVPDNDVKVLHSVIKSRARVPTLQRRPSTRKARQAALKQSREETNEEIGDSSDIFKDTKVPRIEDQSKISLFDDVRQENSSTNRIIFDETISSKSTTLIPTQSKSLFSDDEETDIFSSVLPTVTKTNQEKPPEPKEVATKEKKLSSLFDDEDEDDFFSKPAVLPSRTNRKALFDDEEDDDIFNVLPCSSRKSQVKPAERKVPKTGVKILEKSQHVDDDPLSLGK